MRKIALSTIFTLSSLAVFAQIGEHRNDLSIGVNGGYVMSNVGFTPKVPQGLYTGKTGGLTLRYVSEKYFNSICSIQMELNYTQAGWKEHIWDMDDNPVINKTTGNAEQYERNINYIQMPIFARLGWGRERKGFQFFFQAGPQLGYFMSESTKTNFEFDDRSDYDSDKSGEPATSTVAQDTMAVENKVDYGIAGGIGLEYSNPKIGHIMLEGRYYYGLGDIYGNSKRDYFGRSNIGNIIIKLTYLFDITRTKSKTIK